jgi:hypothetical protein
MSKRHTETKEGSDLTLDYVTKDGPSASISSSPEQDLSCRNLELIGGQSASHSRTIHSLEEEA